MEELPTIQPWHGFTSMFVIFWAVSAYFDHFLMTTVFCIAFGVLSEIFVKTAYGSESEKTPTELETQRKQLDDLVILATEQKNDLAGEAEEEGVDVDQYETIDVDVDDDEEDDDMDDDGPPPPLPVRDYEDDPEDTKTEDLLIHLTDECVLEDAEGEGGQITAKESGRNDVNNSTSSAQSHNSSQLESPDLQSDAGIEAVTDIVTGIDKEVDVSDIVTDIDNIVTINDKKKEITVTIDNDNELELTDIVTIDNKGEEDEVLTVNDNEKIPSCPIISETASTGKTEDGLQNEMNDKDIVSSDDEISQDQPLDLLTSELEEAAARSSDVEAIDIDLTDPAVEAAATKIQSAFKGYKTRKNIGNNSQ